MKLLYRTLTCLSLLVPAVVTMVEDKFKPIHEASKPSQDENPQTLIESGVENAVEIITILENPR